MCDNTGEVTFNAENIVSISPFNEKHIVLFTSAGGHYFPTHHVTRTGGERFVHPFTYDELIEALRGLA